MRKGREILHLPVVAAGNGREIARVDDFFWHGETLTALLVLPMDGHRPALVDVSSVEGWEKDRILLSGVDALTPFDPSTLSVDWRRSGDALGIAVFSDEGRELGRVGDLCLDGDRIVGLEITDGLIQDLFAGRFVLPWQGIWDPGQATISLPGPEDSV